jgi:hypothetical protein
MKTAIAASPPRPGSSREGLGRMLSAICVVSSAMKPRKKYLRNALGAKRAITAPTTTPEKSPGIMVRTSAQSTAPWRSWVRKLESDPPMIAASEVPIARRITDSGGKPWAVNMSASVETMMMPPPMPSSPAKKPTTTPTPR